MAGLARGKALARYRIISFTRSLPKTQRAAHRPGSTSIHRRPGDCHLVENENGAEGKGIATHTFHSHNTAPGLCEIRLDGPCVLTVIDSTHSAEPAIWLGRPFIAADIALSRLWRVTSQLHPGSAIEWHSPSAIIEVTSSCNGMPAEHLRRLFLAAT